MSEDATLDDFVSKTESEEQTNDDEVSVGELQQLEQSPIDSWELVSLGEILSLEYGDNLPSGSRELGAVPVYGSNGQVDTHDEAAVDSPGIVLGRKGSIGEIRFSDKPFWPIDTTYYITKDETSQNLRFLYYLLQNIQLERLNAASAIPGLNRNDTYGLNAIVPPLSEQRKIATVLYNVDQAIQKTEEIVEQARQVKDGVMRDLFKFGIDENGNLRSPENTQYEFKKTPLGRIPDSWECVRLGKIIERSGGFVQTGPFGSQLHKEEYVAEGIPVVMPQNIEKRRIIKDEIAEITPEKASDLARHKMEPNDVVIARRGDLKRAASITEREDGWLCGTGCLLIRPPQTEISGNWLRMAYQHPRSQNQINSRAVGSTMSNLNQSILESLQLALPSVEEQERIVQKVSNVDSYIDCEKRYSARLTRLKRGLMQDLLSGAVRTSNTDIEVPDEIAQHG